MDHSVLFRSRNFFVCKYIKKNKKANLSSSIRNGRKEEVLGSMDSPSSLVPWYEMVDEVPISNKLEKKQKNINTDFTHHLIKLIVEHKCGS